MLARSVSTRVAITSAAVGPSLAHPHVERTTEPERKAALGLVEAASRRRRRPSRRRRRPRGPVVRRRRRDWRSGPRPGSAGHPEPSTRSNPPVIADRSRSMPIDAGSRHQRGSRGYSRRRQRWRRHRRRRRAVAATRPPRAEHGRHDAARPGSCAHLRRIAVQGTGVGHETAHRASNARASTCRSGHGTAEARARDSPIPGRKS